MTASINAVGIGPFPERFFAVEPDEVHVVAMRTPGDRAHEFQQQSGRRASVIGSDKLPVGEILGVEMSGEDDSAAGFSGEFRYDVDHRHSTVRCLGVERILVGLPTAQFNLLVNVRSQGGVRLRSGRPWSESCDSLRELQRGSAAKIGCSGEGGECECQEYLDAQHISQVYRALPERSLPDCPAIIQSSGSDICTRA